MRLLNWPFNLLSINRILRAGVYLLQRVFEHFSSQNESSSSSSHHTSPIQVSSSSSATFLDEGGKLAICQINSYTEGLPTMRAMECQGQS